MSVSGLSQRHAREAVNLTLQAAILGYRNRERLHYSQGDLRWQGIDRRRVAREGEYPNWADCSAFVSWCLWNSLHHRFGMRDIVNGCNWRAGFTGTLYEHGRRVGSPQPADLIIYGSYPGEHVAIFTGGGLCVSHGNEAGPLLIPYDYRPPSSIRRYI